MDDHVKAALLRDGQERVEQEFPPPKETQVEHMGVAVENPPSLGKAWPP